MVRILCLLLAIASAFIAGLLFERNREQSLPHFGPLEGSWEGTFQGKSTKPDGEEVVFPVTLRLVLGLETVQIYVFEGSRWKEVLPGHLRVDYLGTNVLVWKNHSGKIPEEDGSRWYETYLLAATISSPDKLLVRWSRVVNNLDAEIGDSDRTFTSGGEGVLMKLSHGAGA